MDKQLFIVVGMAGSGKTTFCYRLQKWLDATAINLDPAVKNTKTNVKVDIRDKINYKQIMEENNIGPNGAINTCLNLFLLKHSDLLINLGQGALGDGGSETDRDRKGDKNHEGDSKADRGNGSDDQDMSGNGYDSKAMSGNGNEDHDGNGYDSKAMSGNSSDDEDMSGNGYDSKAMSGNGSDDEDMSGNGYDSKAMSGNGNEDHDGNGKKSQGNRGKGKNSDHINTLGNDLDLNFPRRKVDNLAGNSIIIDTPGQIEAFCFSASGQVLTDLVKPKYNTKILYIIDSSTQNSTNFMANMLYAASLKARFNIKTYLVYNKIDLVDKKVLNKLITWCKDFEAFQNDLDYGNMGSTLLSSMCLYFEEFYNDFGFCFVSSLDDQGKKEFVKMVSVNSDNEIGDEENTKEIGKKIDAGIIIRSNNENKVRSRNVHDNKMAREETQGFSENKIDVEVELDKIKDLSIRKKK